MNYSNYTSSHSHGSEKWVPQAILHFQDYGRNGSYFKVTSDFKLLLPASPMELLAGRRILPRLRVGGSGACCRTTPPGTVTAFQWLLQVRPQKRSKQGLNDLVDQKTPDTGILQYEHHNLEPSFHTRRKTNQTLNIRSYGYTHTKS